MSYGRQEVIQGIGLEYGDSPGSMADWLTAMVATISLGSSTLANSTSL